MSILFMILALLFLIASVIIAIASLAVLITAGNVFGFLWGTLWTVLSFCAFTINGLLVCGSDIRSRKKDIMASSNYIKMDFGLFKSVYIILKQYEKENRNCSQEITLYDDNYPLLSQYDRKFSTIKRTRIVFKKPFDEERYWLFYHNEKRSEEKLRTSSNENREAYEGLVKALQKVQNNYAEEAKKATDKVCKGE